MKKNESLSNLKENDLVSLILFALFKIREEPEYASLSEMIYILDRASILKLCEYYGGMTIRIPTISELEELIDAILLYKYIDIDGLKVKEALEKLSRTYNEKKNIQKLYQKIKLILNNYEFSNRK